MTFYYSRRSRSMIKEERTEGKLTGKHSKLCKKIRDRIQDVIVDELKGKIQGKVIVDMKAIFRYKTHDEIFYITSIKFRRT